LEFRVLPGVLYGETGGTADFGWTTSTQDLERASAAATPVAVNNGDNVLTITVRDLGGDPYWVLNGLEVTIANPLAIDATAHQKPGFSEKPGFYAPPVAALTADALAPITTAAIDRWRATGRSPTQSAALAAVTFRVAYLSAYGFLGLAAANTELSDGLLERLGQARSEQPKLRAITKITGRLAVQPATLAFAPLVARLALAVAGQRRSC
jgi:hypothetical protein